jgi:hypothetical protein
MSILSPLPPAGPSRVTTVFQRHTRPNEPTLPAKGCQPSPLPICWPGPFGATCILFLVLRLEQEGAIASAWGTSEYNRRARFYRLTRAGRKLLEAEKREWEQTTAIIAHFFDVEAEDPALRALCRFFARLLGVITIFSSHGGHRRLLEAGLAYSL